MFVAFDLGFDTRPGPNGELIVSIEPQARAALGLPGLDLDLDVSGTNPIVQSAGFFLSLNNTLFDGIGAAFSGDSVSDAVGEAALDVLIPVAATGLDFGPTADLIDSLLVDPLVQQGAEAGATNFSLELEDALNEQISEALELEDGRAEFVLPPNFAQLLQGDVSIEDLLVLVG